MEGIKQMKVRLGDKVKLIGPRWDDINPAIKGTVTGILNYGKDIQLDGHWYYGPSKNLKVIKHKNK